MRLAPRIVGNYEGQEYYDRNVIAVRPDRTVADIAHLKNFLATINARNRRISDETLQEHSSSLSERA